MTTISDPPEKHVLVLGIGNLLWADEGFGVRAAEALHAGFRLPAEVRVMDGGTQGLFLLPYVQRASRLLIFDAIDFGLAPGEIRVIRDDEVPRYMGAKKVSMHQTGFQEVLACARLLGDYPTRLALIGVQPVVLDDYGGSLRPQVRARIPEAVALAVEVLREWGLALERRSVPIEERERIGPAELDMLPYERDRPRAIDFDP
jgi:hydrogenase maturation protease